MENQLNYNIVVIALFCLIAGIIPRWFLKIPLYFLVLYSGLFLNFPQNMSFSLNWGAIFWERLVNLNQLFIMGRIGYLPEEIAVSLVFFFMILLIELVIEYERVVISYLIIICYMLFLTIYNDIELHVEIVLFASLGLLQRFLIVHKKNKQNYLVITALLSVFLLVTLAIPSEFIETKMLEPSATLRNYLNTKGFYQFIEETGAGNLSRSGFSENDEVLGGPLLDDNQIILEAQQRSPHYWRIDSKSRYTGSGWESLGSEDAVLDAYNGTQIELPNNDYQGSFAEKEEIRLNREVLDSYLPLPYGNKQVRVEDATTELYVNQETQRVDFQNTSQPDSFQIDWQDFDYTMEELADVSLATPDSALDYLQLPEQLPERVSDLAEELTAEEDTLIGQVTAIQDYLKNSGNFRYSKIDAGFPTENQDYVDHFLFNSQVGYCDNFSSAMVVMLRSVGIPARWTKGFTSGEEVSEDRYVVRNSDAHSWPEVYFEGYGWLPFEPTPSFSQPLEQTDAAANDNTDSSTTNSSTTEETTETSSTQSSSTTSTESTTATETEEGTGPTNNRFLQISPFVRNILYGGLIVAILGLVYILWRNYFYLYMLVLIKINNASILKIYPKLLNRVEKFVFRTPEQPLNQYAQIFEERYPEFNGTFIKLTDSYEKSLYGSVAEVDEQERKLIFELTRKLAKIKK